MSIPLRISRFLLAAAAPLSAHDATYTLENRACIAWQVTETTLPVTHGAFTIELGDGMRWTHDRPGSATLAPGAAWTLQVKDTRAHAFLNLTLTPLPRSGPFVGTREVRLLLPGSGGAIVITPDGELEGPSGPAPAPIQAQETRCEQPRPCPPHDLGQLAPGARSGSRWMPRGPPFRCGSWSGPEKGRH